MGKFRRENGHTRLRALVEKAKRAMAKIPKEVVDLAASEIPGFNLIRAALAVVRKDEELEPLLREELEVVLLEMYADLEYTSRRHETDTWSDSWLAKNVRPISFIIILAINIWILFCSSFFYKVDYSAIQEGKAYFFQFTEKVQDHWRDLLEYCIYFFFGSRGLEKISRVIAPALTKNQNHA